MMNINEIHIQGVFEFNRTSQVNFFERHDKKIYGVVCLPGFEPLFYNFDKIIRYPFEYPKNILLTDNREKKLKIQNQLTEYAKSIGKKGIVDINKIHPVVFQNILDEYKKALKKTKTTIHPYEFVFSNLSKDMQEKRTELYKPLKKDYEKISAHVSGIDKKIITINGRNLSGDRNYKRNITCEELIKFLLNNNYYVINCTLPKPNLKIKHKNYMELATNELFNYSINMSYFLNSHCLISIANAGGITNHICTKTNTILYKAEKSKGDGWVDNPRFGFKGKSLFDISSEIKPTFLTKNHVKIKSILDKLDKPSDIDFFNENKIVK